ncbi:MAG: hypothetical protein GW809_07825 [Bacteroidetes bacterium]|nr:hypothetical protein [Bacteroidota bacterium]NCQ12031.1 hypothetical protein [Bacteroidota bacterium]
MLKKIIFSLILVVVLISPLSAQYYKDSMRGFKNLNVRMLPLSPDAIRNKVSSYMFTGKLERELASIGARLTVESKAEAYAVIDVELSDSQGIAYGYQIRIRFMRLLEPDKKSKKSKKIPITLWETSRLGYSPKIDLRNQLEDNFEIVLQQFIREYSEANN